MKKISCKWHNEISIFLCIRWCTYILFGFSLFAIVYTLCNAASEYYIDLFSKQSYITFIQLFAPFSSLFYGTIITATAYVALMVYHKSQKVDEAQALREVRIMLNSSENIYIHSKLVNGGDWHNPQKMEEALRNDSDRVQIFNYIGTLEYVYLLVENSVISLNSAKKQFGYRVLEIEHNKRLMEYLFNEKDSWTDFFALINILKQQ